MNVGFCIIQLYWICKPVLTIFWPSLWNLFIYKTMLSANKVNFIFLVASYLFIFSALLLWISILLNKTGENTHLCIITFISSPCYTKLFPFCLFQYFLNFISLLISFFYQLAVQECVVNSMCCEFSVFVLLFISNCIPFLSKESVDFNLFKFAKICFVIYPMIHPEVYSVYTCETFVYVL